METKQLMEEAFERWGLPYRIKIDNGYPFKPIRSRELPSLSMLWWAGLGIDPCLNQPATPQQNGSVEGLQRITFRWLNPAKYNSIEACQEAAIEITRQQRETYRIRAKGDKTRRELYPELEQKLRGYHPGNFQFEKVEEYFTKFVFARKVSTRGSISFAGVKIPISQAMVGRSVYLRYEPDQSLWLISNRKGELIKQSYKPILSEENILNMNPLAKT